MTVIVTVIVSESGSDAEHKGYRIFYLESHQHRNASGDDRSEDCRHEHATDTAITILRARSNSAFVLAARVVLRHKHTS